ncbi:phototropin-1A isoform X2 [Selaginella moellendorffii]|nr:phototropin-1A isoform X2 [Selaginella moellendorffii]|eukprot:XP_002982959.2 phototropin-1A isoform X2 [Selaginella moellendorffii]
MEALSKNGGRMNEGAQQRGGIDMLGIPRPQLPRDARGSLEVFQPQQQRSGERDAGIAIGVADSRNFGRSGRYGAQEQQVFGGRSVESTLDLATTNAGWRRSPSGSGSKSPVCGHFQGDFSSIAKPQNDRAAAERAAEWGLVLKADVGSGKIQGVGVRNNSGDSKTSGRNSGRRTSEESSSDAGSEAALGGRPHIPRVSEDLKDALSSFQQTFVVCDATDPELPILYASAGFFSMTGYTAKEVIGRNCRFLQGTETDPADVSKIRVALEQGKSFCGRLLNYKKNGTPFWNLLTIAPIKDEDGKVLKYIGMLVEVSQFTEGSKDKAVRPNGMPESLIKYDARQKDSVVSSVSELVEVFSTSKTDQSNDHDRRASAGKLTDVPEASPVKASKRTRRSSSLLSFLRRHVRASAEIDQLTLKTADNVDDFPEDFQRKKEIRRGIDLATTLERIEKNFVITDPRLPDNPIIFASDSFLELTEYSREEILGKNCRFLQGPDTNQETVTRIRYAIRDQRSITVQLLNYTKRGKPFWNLFHLQPMRDNKGELQYFIGVQLDGSQHFDKVRKGLPDKVEHEGVQVIQSAAGNVDTAVRELPDANQNVFEIWRNYSKKVCPKPHKVHSTSWAAINKVVKKDGLLNLQHFRPVKALGSGDTGGVHLVELRETGQFFAMKAMEKSIMLNRNKVHRTLMERDILDMMDHPFLPTLYGSFETEAHVCLITDFCPGGELFLLLDRQPSKTFNEPTVCFYAAEVVVALEYLHCRGVVYRDLKPENILVQRNGHLLLTDFDLSFVSNPRAQVIRPPPPASERRKRKKEAPVPPTFVAEPVARSNSFVGTEEYIAPEVINGSGHSSAVDWWALGILLYEMLVGWTPFRGKNRQKTFHNILHKELKFPSTVQVSPSAKELIHRLLQKDPSQRLGSSMGANEIKHHPFFTGVRWPLIRCKSCPRLDAPLTLTDDFVKGTSTTDAFAVF